MYTEIQRTLGHYREAEENAPNSEAICPRDSSANLSEPESQEESSQPEMHTLESERIIKSPIQKAFDIML
ncbi:hypothetical protein NPIL_395991 [Nephila pilipes]|uniref:Uncharacterized protein n=1 Tax=Nephila pilipes TaxID=299642 RepID=A0A8X6MME0_NEPPI|nr:hypothetical protein NPIL_395991 [Nephila pilipes]